MNQANQGKNYGSQGGAPLLFATDSGNLLSDLSFLMWKMN